MLCGVLNGKENKKRGYVHTYGFPGAQRVKNPPALHVTQLLSLDREGPLEEEMATHSSILPWRTPQTGA